jgi:hypothetical protein
VVAAAGEFFLSAEFLPGEVFPVVESRGFELWWVELWGEVLDPGCVLFLVSQPVAIHININTVEIPKSDGPRDGVRIKEFPLVG